ncbi:hypothetical protein Mal52_08730 [Symmachiella dynata]|uniref:Uncharacterized protein n=1 Tax=Symmachiella dynata TaxID=2527995 RepID=A0A517ZIV0_9PLAN|nr:hypothetical protein Mal52_08730 [Symmachiella dynata]
MTTPDIGESRLPRPEFPTVSPPRFTKPFALPNRKLWGFGGFRKIRQSQNRCASLLALGIASVIVHCGSSDQAPFQEMLPVQNPFAKKSLTEGYQFLKHANRRLPMPTDPQDPQQQLQKLFKINMWLGIAAIVLLILLIASVIAPYIHFGTTGDTDKLLDKLNEMEKSIQANATGKLTAQHFDKELKSFKCEVRKPTTAASPKTNEDTAKMLKQIEELKAAIQSIQEKGVTAKQLDRKLKPLLSELRALREPVQQEADK